MPDPRKEPSLDEIVAQSAIVVADQIQKAAAWAKSEMDLQVEVASALNEFKRRAQITLEGHHNVTIATGRPDSVYGSVIVEYKDPGTLSPNRDASTNKAVIEQLERRFYDIRREQNRPWNSMFGVGTDGKYFIFLRFRDEKWTDQEPLEVNPYSTKRFLWALYNLGQKGKPYQPEYLHGDFGSDKTQKTPFSTARVSCHGRPRPSARRDGRNSGSSTAHWASVRSMHWIYAHSHNPQASNGLNVFMR